MANKWVGFPNTNGVPSSPIGSWVDYGSTGDRVYGRQWTATENGTITGLNIRWGSTVNGFGTDAWYSVYVNGALVGYLAIGTPATDTWSGYQTLSVQSGESLSFVTNDVIVFGYAYDSALGRISRDNGSTDGNTKFNSSLSIPPLPTSVSFSASSSHGFAAILRYDDSPLTTAPPTTAAPTTTAPTTAAPTTLAPTTLAPTSLAPTTLAPTTLAPTTIAATTPAPPTTLFQTTAGPTTKAPTTPIYTTVAPTTEHVATTPSPTTTVPTTLAPTTLFQTTIGPTTKPPTTLVPTTLAPTTVAPTTIGPTTISPTTVAPTTSVPTTTLTTIPPTTAAPEIICIKNLNSTIIEELFLGSVITKEIKSDGHLC